MQRDTQSPYIGDGEECCGICVAPTRNGAARKGGFEEEEEEGDGGNGWSGGCGQRSDKTGLPHGRPTAGRLDDERRRAPRRLGFSKQSSCVCCWGRQVMGQTLLLCTTQIVKCVLCLGWVYGDRLRP
ncbi:hypothetical protein SORBI_3008G094650 [Sorghum bicolor]|uniref:Uncharacterized protein n=1 Tax=Sorghum bicolor TaxID=4558 RepID=A0A1Z5R6M4_SORBI|nr:hypothetical protein SORBI_3008G094650 [Sorghum bicolor]